MATAQQQAPPQQEEGGIPIESLPIAELGRIKKTLDQEQTNLIKNYEQLKLAMGRFVRSQRAISDLKETIVGTETLIPLTQSMYVPAKTTSNNKLLLAIGTGYYTEKNANEAGEFFDRKLKFLKARSQELEALIRQKQAQAKQLMQVYQQKVKVQAEQNSKLAAN